MIKTPRPEPFDGLWQEYAHVVRYNELYRLILHNPMPKLFTWQVRNGFWRSTSCSIRMTKCTNTLPLFLENDAKPLSILRTNGLTPSIQRFLACWPRSSNMSNRERQYAQLQMDWTNAYSWHPWTVGLHCDKSQPVESAACTFHTRLTVPGRNWWLGCWWRDTRPFRSNCRTLARQWFECAAMD